MRLLPLVVLVVVSGCTPTPAVPEVKPAGTDSTTIPPVPTLDAPASNAGACEAAGGKCVAVSACQKGAGSLGEPSCGSASIVCCMTGCGVEDFLCCQGSASFRPVCKGGKLECLAGQNRCPK
jgi:hypothetical protein